MSAVYLDHAAAAPLSPAARAAWLEAAAMTGNPSSSHGPGRAARRIVERAREEVAALAGADPLDVIFTSGGTEADNLAVIGLARARRAVDSRCRRIIVSAVEHPAVLGPARQLASEGFELVELPVDASGRVDLSQAAAVIDADRESVALVSCQWTNNETGAIQPLAELAAWARAGGAPIHCDAVQAFAYEAVRLTPAPGSDGPELDALTLSAHKIGGPVGVGALLARRRWPFQPVLFGGGQENGRRPGTVPAALIAAFAAALAEAAAARAAERARLGGLSDRLRAGLAALGAAFPTFDNQILSTAAGLAAQAVAAAALPAAGPVAMLAGPADPAWRSPHIVLALFPGCLGDDLLLLLDAAGIACSTGSACSAGLSEASHVLLAMGYDEPSARSALRFSLGRTSTAADVEALLAALPAILSRVREAPPWPA